MSALGKIFTWWDGATIGRLLFTKASQKVGVDAVGNAYYQGGEIHGRPRRWVIYSGSNDASRVTPEWHGWLHNTVDELPDISLPPPRRYEKEAKANLTGTAGAYRPAGSLEATGQRPPVTGDYEAWSPDA